MNTLAKREAFLTERKSGLGGSDAAAACGLDPFKSARALYEEKTGGLTEFSDNRFTRAGRILESGIADLFAEVHGLQLRKKHVMATHRKHPFMLAHVDRVVVGQRALVEVKNVDGFVYRNSGEWGEEDTDHVPLRYLFQALHYLVTLDYEVCFFAVLVGGNDLKRYVVRRDKETEELLVENERAFWIDHVMKGLPPSHDFDSGEVFKLVKRLHPGSDGRIIELPEDVYGYHLALQDAVKREKSARLEADGYRARILDAMNGAAIGRFSVGGEYRYSQIHREGYTVQATDFTTLRYCKSSKDVTS
jgi:putative phage-type endonuclease